MKHLIILTALILTFSSCITQRRCNQKFPPQTSTITETITETVYRDTIIYIQLPPEIITSPGDTVYINKVTGLQYSDRSILRTSFALSWAQVVNGVLRHELQQNDTLISRAIQDAVKEKSITVETVKEAVLEINVLKWWQKVLIWVGGLSVLVWLIIIYNKLSPK
jgi:hypothetical protein